MLNKKEFKFYLLGRQTEKELDDNTKKLVKDYYEDEEIRERLSRILETEHNLGKIEEADIINISAPNNEKRNKIIYAVLIGIAASFLTFFLFLPNQNKTIINPVDRILAESYSHPVQNRSAIKGSNNHSIIRNDAFQFYAKDNYNQAITNFEYLSSNVEFDEEIEFYLALSYLYNNQAPIATRRFTNLLSKNNIQRKDAIIWFLALSLLEEKQFEESKIYLKQISLWQGNTSRNKKANQAKKLLVYIKDNYTKPEN